MDKPSPLVRHKNKTAHNILAIKLFAVGLALLFLAISFKILDVYTYCFGEEPRGFWIAMGEI